MTHLATASSIGCRLDGQIIESELDEEGYVVLPGLITEAEVSELLALSGSMSVRPAIELSDVDLGSGQFVPLTHPLPRAVSTILAACYPGLVGIANRWNETMGLARRFPETISKKAAPWQLEQALSHPWFLDLKKEDYVALHQRPPSDGGFPFKITLMLSSPEDYTGGELVMTEQRPRMQSRPMVVRLASGDAVISTESYRPHKGRKGFYRVNFKHAVSRVRSGQRITLELRFNYAGSN